MRRILGSAAVAAALVFTAAAPTTAATNDPLRPQQWGLDNIAAEAAWSQSTGTGALVAVVDTGVDLTHPDLAGNIVSYPDADFVEPAGTCTGNKKTGRTCTQDGAQDKNGHGTHVAGIIAAIANNGTGVAGVAPGAKILPVRVLDADGAGSSDQIAAGIRYAADKGADVINLSLGYLSGVGTVIRAVGDPTFDAIAYAQSKGAVVLVAAGNDSVPLCAEPAGADGVVCVGSVDRNDLPSFYTNTDSTTLQNYLVAPGGQGTFCEEDIVSTWLRTAEPSVCDLPGGYEYLAGTSMATPHVSGVAALLAAQGLSGQQIIDRLLATADDLGASGDDPVYGSGRVNAARAVGAI